MLRSNCLNNSLLCSFYLVVNLYRRSKRCTLHRLNKEYATSRRISLKSILMKLDLTGETAANKVFDLRSSSLTSIAPGESRNDHIWYCYHANVANVVVVLHLVSMLVS